MRHFKTFKILITFTIFAGSCTPRQSLSPPATENRPESSSAQSSRNSNTSPTAIDPCSLLTKEEVAAVLGESVPEAKVVSFPRPNCVYSVSSGGQVVVFAFNDPSARGGFEIGKTAQDTNAQPIAGVGDDAYWSPSIKTINVLSGDVYLMVQLFSMRSEPLATAKALALKAISRLP